MDDVSEVWACLALRRNLLRLGYAVSAFLVLTAPIAAALSLDMRMLAVWLVLPCAFASILVADTLILARWRHRRMDAWRRGNGNLAVLAGAIINLPVLPKPSLAAMLRTLPILTPAQDRDLDPGGRAALAAFSDWRWVEETAAALLPAALLALLSGAAAALLLTGTIPDLRSGATVLVLLASLMLIRYGIPRWRRGQLARAWARLDPEAARATRDLIEALDWSATSEARRREMLETFDRVMFG